MRKKRYAVLRKIDNNRIITEESDAEFLLNLQRGLLLALAERGFLNAMQYRQAENALDRQRRT